MDNTSGIPLMEKPILNSFYLFDKFVGGQPLHCYTS